MGIMWFLLGVLACSSVWLVTGWAKRQQKRLSIPAWTGAVLTILTGLFALAWSLSSLYKGEVQSAAMGLLLFGGLTVLLGLATAGVFFRKMPAQKSEGGKGLSA